MKFHYPEKTGQSFKAGEVVCLSGLGQVYEMASNTPAFALGVAAQDASAVVNTMRGVWLFNGDTVWEISVYHGTAGSAVTANALVGGRYEFERITASSIVSLDISAVDPNGPIILAIGHKDTLGDRYGRVLIQMHPKIRQFGCTSFG